MNDLLINQWAESTASQAQKENGFSILTANCIMLSPTVNPEEARLAYENYIRIAHGNASQVRLVMVPMLISINA